jgi:hypothetical protein
MRARKLLLIAVAIFGLSAPALAESRRIMGGSAGGSKYQFFYDTFLDPSMPELGNMGGGTIGGEGTITRFISDRRQRVYFGYDVTIEELPEPNTYRITFGQLTAERVRQLLSDEGAGWTQLPAPNWGGPAVRTIRSGEVLGLDLLTNSTTGQKIVDYVTVKGSSFNPAWDFIYETGTAADFRAEDASLELLTPHITVNGPQGTSAIATGLVMYGPALWFYLPMHGRFMLSLTPRPDLGFVKAGEVRGTTLTFDIGDDMYSVVSSQRIAPGQRPFNLYVHHDPEWRPPDGDPSIWAGGSAASPEDLIESRGTRQ